MASIHEKLTAQFYQWEQRGRGYQVWPEPVTPEPPFAPFFGHYLPFTPPIDDGQIPTPLSSLVGKIGRLFQGRDNQMVETTVDEEPAPQVLSREPLIELQIVLPPTLNARREDFAEFLSTLSHCHEPITFELLGTASQVTAQLAVHPYDESLVKQRFQAFFPEAVIQSRHNTLGNAWEARPDTDTIILEFGLAHAFMLPLAGRKLDPYLGLIGALSDLSQDDLGLFQVIFQPVASGWSDSTLRAVTDHEGRPFFENAPELLAGAKEKLSSPLLAAVVRIATKAATPERCFGMARNLASALSVFADPQGNELLPLKNDRYPFDLHVEDVLCRQSHRSGMILNLSELVGLVHLPSADVRSPKLERHTTKTKAAPASVRGVKGLLLGDNEDGGKVLPVRLTTEQRVRHLHIIGASGTGKSTLLFNLIRQDIENGEGLAVLDPHGDLVDKILGIIPANRINDVIVLDPSDEEYSIGFNILSAHSENEKVLLASDLVSVFQRLSASWGDQMASVLNNAILAFLESTRGGTLADLRRFLLEPKYRDNFLETVTDPDVVYYWRKVFQQLSGNKSLGPVLTRLETFLSRKPIRYMVSQTENKLDFANILDTGKIFLAKLPHGTIGRENAYLLGTLLVSKFQQIAMGRQSQAETSRRPFWLYIDEFHNFITPSMAEILSGARKYRLGLVLAHQELRQLQRDSEVASAVLSNAGTRICFRVGDDDAKKLSDGFATFDTRDLQNLGVGQALCRVERGDNDFNLAVTMSPAIDEGVSEQRRQEIITASRAKYGVPRSQVEAMLRQMVETETAAPAPKTRARAVPVKDIPLPPAVPTPPAPPIVPAPPEEPVTNKSPADLGRGGAQHQAIQQRLKQEAEALGFRAIIEKQILDGLGSIDLLLERAGQTLACEITVTTTIDHEVGNVSKCLKAGFRQVAVISPDENRLRRIAMAVESSLGEEATKQVLFFLPDQFIAHLNTLPEATPSKPDQPKMRRGYKVTTKHVELSPQEMKAREDAAIMAIADAMRANTTRKRL